MTKRTIQHKPTTLQALIWLIALVIIPFTWYFRNGISAYWFKKTQCTEPRKREWRNFNIPIPPGYTVHGIDVSHYSCNIDWEMVKDMNQNGIKVQFAFMRATKGLDLVDYQLSENWEGTKKAKILRGCYHFYNFGDDPIRQARFFLDNVSIETGDLPPVLDIENDKKTDDTQMDKASVIKNIQLWLSTVERASGVKPIIYVNLDYYKRYISGNFSEYKIWIANYNNPKGIKLIDKRPWHFWQLSEKAQCNGISEKIDFNVFSGNIEDLKMLCK